MTRAYDLACGGEEYTLRKGQKLVNWVILQRVQPPEYNPQYPKAFELAMDEHRMNVEQYIFYMSDAEFEEAVSS
jgi:hypothetical protein